MLLLPVLIFVLSVFGLLRLIWLRRYRGIPECLAAVLAVLVCGVWAVFQSQSSTGALGLLILPFHALLAAWLAWGGAQARPSPRPWLVGLGWLMRAAALAVPLFLLYQGFQTRALNQQRAAAQAAFGAEIEGNRARIQALLRQRPGEEGAQLDALLQAHAGERAWLLPLLEQPQLRAESLDRWAESADGGVLLSVARHPNTRAETLARLYSRPGQEGYFSSDLAAHPNTPPELLEALYRAPRSIDHLDRHLARNPALPPALMRELIEQTRDFWVLQNLLANPGFRCELQPALRAALARSERPDDADMHARLQQAACVKREAAPP